MLEGISKPIDSVGVKSAIVQSCIADKIDELEICLEVLKRDCLGINIVFGLLKDVIGDRLCVNEIWFSVIECVCETAWIRSLVFLIVNQLCSEYEIK